MPTNQQPTTEMGKPHWQSATFEESAKDYVSNFGSMRRWLPQIAASKPCRILENILEYIITRCVKTYKRK